MAFTSSVVMMRLILGLESRLSHLLKLFLSLLKNMVNSCCVGHSCVGVMSCRVLVITGKLLWWFSLTSGHLSSIKGSVLCKVCRLVLCSLFSYGPCSYEPAALRFDNDLRDSWMYRVRFLLRNLCSYWASYV